MVWSKDNLQAVAWGVWLGIGGWFVLYSLPHRCSPAPPRLSASLAFVAGLITGVPWLSNWFSEPNIQDSNGNE